MRESLLAFLQAIHDMEIATYATALEDLPASIAHLRPQALVVDAALAEEASLLQLVRRLRAEHPTLYCIVLADSLRQQKACLAAGATHALLKGRLDMQLRAAILNIAVRTTAYEQNNIHEA